MSLVCATPHGKHVAVAVNETIMLTTVAVFTTSAGFFYAAVVRHDTPNTPKPNTYENTQRITVMLRYAVPPVQRSVPCYSC